MIDLHAHVLPGLDDGPASFTGALALARAAVAQGTKTLVATPHFRSDFVVTPSGIAASVATLSDRLRQADITVALEAGAEVSLARAAAVNDQVAAQLCLGSGRYMLVESPYRAPTVDIRSTLGSLQSRGFHPILAHPERCPYFQKHPDRLEELVDGGVVCSVTGGSLEGRFGDVVRRFALSLFSRGLVHNVASDAHDDDRRPPRILPGLRAAERELPGLMKQAPWLTETSPAAILSGDPIPSPPND